MKCLIYLRLLQFLSCYCESTQKILGSSKLLWGSIDPLWLSRPINPPLKSSYFGNSVSISKTNIVIGAPGTCGSLDLNQVCNPIGSGNGAVYIYTYTTQFNGLSLHSTLSAPNDAMAFGWAVTMSNNNDLLLISARRTGASTSIDYGFDDGYGSAYMYSHNSSTDHWDLIQSFSQQNYTTNFGNSLSMLPDGSMFAVGAPSYYSNVGQVFIYKRDSNSSWFIQQILTSPVTNSVDFGRSVVLYNNTKYNRLQIIIGSPYQHKVFIYTFDPILDTWDSNNYQIITPVDAISPNFGTNVGLSSKYAFVSNPILNSLFVYKYNVISFTWRVYQTISVSVSSARQTGFASSFQVIDDGHTLVIASTSAKKGFYLYKYNATTETYYEFSFESTATVIPSQGQLTVAVTPGPNYQVIVGAGADTIPSIYFNYTRAPDPTQTPTSAPTYTPTTRSTSRSSYYLRASVSPTAAGTAVPSEQSIILMSNAGISTEVSNLVLILVPVLAFLFASFSLCYFCRICYHRFTEQRFIESRKELQSWIENHRTTDSVASDIRLDPSVKTIISCKSHMVNVFHELHTEGPEWWCYKNQQTYHPTHEVFYSSSRNNNTIPLNDNDDSDNCKLSNHIYPNSQSVGNNIDRNNFSNHNNRSPLQSLSLDYNIIHPNNKSPLTLINYTNNNNCNTNENSAGHDDLLYNYTTTATLSNINTSHHFDNMRPNPNNNIVNDNHNNAHTNDTHTNHNKENDDINSNSTRATLHSVQRSTKLLLNQIKKESNCSSRSLSSNSTSNGNFTSRSVRDLFSQSLSLSAAVTGNNNSNNSQRQIIIKSPFTTPRNNNYNSNKTKAESPLLVSLSSSLSYQHHHDESHSKNNKNIFMNYLQTASNGSPLPLITSTMTTNNNDNDTTKSISPLLLQKQSQQQLSKIYCNKTSVDAHHINSYDSSSSNKHDGTEDFNRSSNNNNNNMIHLLTQQSEPRYIPGSPNRNNSIHHENDSNNIIKYNSSSHSHVEFSENLSLSSSQQQHHSITTTLSKLHQLDNKLNIMKEMKQNEIVHALNHSTERAVSRSMTGSSSNSSPQSTIKATNAHTTTPTHRRSMKNREISSSSNHSSKHSSYKIANYDKHDNITGSEVEDDDDESQHLLTPIASIYCSHNEGEEEVVMVL